MKSIWKFLKKNVTKHLFLEKIVRKFYRRKRKSSVARWTIEITLNLILKQRILSKSVHFAPKFLRLGSIDFLKSLLQYSVIWRRIIGLFYSPQSKCLQFATLIPIIINIYKNWPHIFMPPITTRHNNLALLKSTRVQWHQ